MYVFIYKHITDKLASLRNVIHYKYIVYHIKSKKLIANRISRSVELTSADCCNHSELCFFTDDCIRVLTIQGSRSFKVIDFSQSKARMSFSVLMSNCDRFRDIAMRSPYSFGSEDTIKFRRQT